MTRLLGGTIFWWNISWNWNKSPSIKLVCAFHQLKNCLFTSSTRARVVFPTLFVIIAKNQLGRWHQKFKPTNSFGWIISTITIWTLLTLAPKRVKEMRVVKWIANPYSYCNTIFWSSKPRIRMWQPIYSLGKNWTKQWSPTT